LEIGQPLTFLNRTPLVNATDDDIIGEFSGQIFAADLITDDAEAVVVEGGRMETRLAQGSIPNIKIGASVSQSTINALDMMARNVQLDEDADLITGWENQLARNLVTGVRQTMNYLCAAMQLDGLVYDRLGVKITAGFGTPSALKPTVTPWTNTAGATPVSNIQNIAMNIGPGLGKSYNRITMSTEAFNYAVATDEFATRVRQLLRLEADQFYLNPYDVVNLRALFSAATGMQLEIEDTTFRVRNPNGSQTQQRVLPANKVILSNTTDDNNPAAYDFANGIPTETIVAPFIAGAPDIGGRQFGPVSYYDGNPSLNPPNLKAWAVARGFPRRHDKLATAILTVF
jgi:hypothetical protein